MYAESTYYIEIKHGKAYAAIKHVGFWVIALVKCFIKLYKEKRRMALDGVKDVGAHLNWGADPPANMPKGHKAHKTKTIEPKKKGQKPISFKENGLHASTHTKPGEKISAAKHEEAKEGKLGPKAKKQEEFYENVLKKK